MSLKLNETKRIVMGRNKTPCLLNYANINRKMGYFNDVTIKSGYDCFPANRVVLSCYCRFFEKLFKSEKVKKNYIEIQQVDGLALHNLIEYIYSGCINISSVNAFDLLAGAHHLELDEVKEFCFDFLFSVMTTDNCISIYKEIVKYENFDFKQNVYKLISGHFHEVSQTEDFRSLTYFELFPCLYNLNRELVAEADLCKSMIDWTKFDRESRKEWFRDRLIRFVDIKKLPYEILQNIVCEKLMEENEDRLRLVKTRMEDIRNNQRIISIGGVNTEKRVLEIWKSQNKTNQHIPDLPFPVYGNRSLKFNKFVFCIGGCRSSYNDVTNDVWRLDLDEDVLKWKQIKSMKVKRNGFGAVVFNNFLVVCGGWNGSKRLSSSEAYLPKSNQWLGLPPMNEKRVGHELVAVKGYLYAIGGHDGNSPLSSVERLHCLAASWNWSIVSLITPRTSFAAVVFDDVIYVLGGIGKNRQPLESVEIYNLSTGNVSHGESMNVGRCGHKACVSQSKIFVVGGWNSENEFVREIECFDFSINRWKIIGKTDYKFADHSLIVF